MQLFIEICKEDDVPLIVDTDGECWGCPITYEVGMGPSEGKYPKGWTDAQWDAEFLGEIFPTSEEGEYTSKNGYNITLYS